MKKYLQAYLMTQSMFCAIPCPWKVWNEKIRSHMLLFLPVIGLEIGIVWVLLHLLLRFLHVPDMIYGLGMCAVPYLMCGFIHLDGFLDVIDAISSWKTLEQRRAILKDSGVGAFAVIWCVLVFLSGFALFSSVPEGTDPTILLAVPVISRCCSAIAVMKLKPMSVSQYAGAIGYPRWHAVCLVVLILICTVLGFIFCGSYGWVLIGSLIGYVLALHRSYGLLEGMNGDISGFCLTVSELCGVAVFALL